GGAEGGPVRDEQERVELLEAPELRHRGRGPGIAAGGDVHAGHERERAPQVRDPAVAQLVAADDRDVRGHAAAVFGHAGRGHLDVLLVLGRGRRGRRGLGRDDGRYRSEQGTNGQEKPGRWAHRSWRIGARPDYYQVP